MGAPQLEEEIFRVIQGGANLGDPAKIIQFTSDNGTRSWSVVKETAQSTNGSSTNVFVAAAIAIVEGVRTAVSSGLAMLTMDIGIAGVAIAPALGINGGIILYNLAPDFWTDVAGKIYDAGWTIGNKVTYFIDETGRMFLPEDVINIYKDSFLEAGIFDEIPGAGELDPIVPYTPHYTYSTPIPMLSSITVSHDWDWTGPTDFDVDHITYSAENAIGTLIVSGVNYEVLFITKTPGNVIHVHTTTILNNGTVLESDYDSAMSREIIVNDETYYTGGIITGGSQHATTTFNSSYTTSSASSLYDAATQTVEDIINYFFNNTNVNEDLNPLLNPDSKYPDATPIGPYYPEWHPLHIDLPLPVEVPFQIPQAYPVEFPDKSTEPEIDPDAGRRQREAQDPEEDPEESTKRITFDAPGFNVDPKPDPDPDPGDEPDVIDEDDEGGGEDPIDPDPPIPPTPVILPINLPTSISSNKLFTVYNPSPSQLDQLGGFLWNLNILEDLKKIWQDPLDGVISLIQVFCTPLSGGSQHIILGCLDSEVSSKVVNSQFVTIDCGSINLDELNQNATDYAPYTSLHIFLPFIGITELDVNECMRGSISVKYKVDVYTGTCLAEVKITRNPDVPNGAILYTFNGNCSQQIPLTSANASGLLGAIINCVGMGLSVATGGNLGVLAGANMVGHTVNREMIHVSHSGNISANSGIMGQKKPYLIIGRARPYNANSYNTQYGYPVNKTVYLSNCTGFARVKSIKLKTSATDVERQEILELLEEGVFM